LEGITFVLAGRINVSLEGARAMKAVHITCLNGQ